VTKHILCMSFLILCLQWSLSSEILIITNPNIQISALKKKDIQEIFTGKKTRWNNDKKIIIATLENSKTHQEFMRDFVKKTPFQFKNYWRQKVYSGEGMLPKTFKDEENLIQFVAETEGAIGYISTRTEKTVKMITISDK